MDLHSGRLVMRLIAIAEAEFLSTIDDGWTRKGWKNSQSWASSVIFL